MLDEEMALEAAGESSLSSITQLVVRHSQITSLDCGESLVNLRVLSLSHNKLEGSLRGFGRLSELEELNLNFNSLTDVEDLGTCLRLRKIFLSNNSISTTRVFSKLSRLEVLCLFNNNLKNLHQTLKDVERVRELDLQGNPLASVSNYKSCAMKALSRVEKLDGEPATQASFKWNSLPKGKIKLYDSDTLNTNPLVLTYLADHHIHGDEREKEDGPQTVEKESPSRIGRMRKSSFVDKLRGQKKVPKERREDEEEEWPAGGVVTSATDASDPYQTVRRLIHLVEKLQSEISSLRQQTPTEDVSEELTRLRIENSNMYQLKEDNASLNLKFEQLTTKLAVLTKENQLLRQRISSEPSGDSSTTLSETLSPRHKRERQRFATFESRVQDEEVSETLLGLDESISAQQRSERNMQQLSEYSIATSGDKGHLQKSCGSLPELSDILTLRKFAGDDDSAWESMAENLRGSPQSTDKVTISTRHAWVLFGNRQEEATDLSATMGSY